MQSGEHFDAVQQEMMIHLAVQHHPNILPLLDYCCSEPGPPAGPPLPPAAAPPPSGTASAAGAAGHSPSSLYNAAFGDRGQPPQPQPQHPHYHSHATLHEPQPLQPKGAPWALATAHPHMTQPHPQAPARGLDGQRGMPSSGGGAAVEVAASCSRVACFLFPVFREGTLAAELERLAARGERLATADVLSLFIQVRCVCGLAECHGG